MMALITPISASWSRVIESVRISRSDHDLMSSQRSSGKPRRSAVRRDGSWAARSWTTSSRPCVADGVDELVDPRLEERLVLLHGPGREPPADEPALLEVLGIVEGDHVRLLHPDVGPVGAPRGEHVAAPLDVDQVGVAGDGPQAVGLVAVHGCFAAGPGEEVVHPVEVGPPGRVEQVGGAGVDRAHGRTVLRTRRRQRASMSITTPMPTTRVRAMFCVRHATRAATTPARKPGLPQVELALGAEEGRHDDGGQRGRRDLAQQPLDPRAARRRGGGRTRGTTPASRRCRCRPARSRSRPGSRDDARGRAAAACRRAGRGARGRPPRTRRRRCPPRAPKSTPRWPAPASSANRATRPPTMAATAAGRELIAGTSRTRKTSGTAKSSGSESGTAEPMRIPTIVHTCQLAHSRSGGAEVVGHLVVEARARAGRRRPRRRPPSSSG